VEWIQFDEPFLALNLTDKEEMPSLMYTEINKRFPKIKLILANYFDCFGENLETVLALPVHTLHLDSAAIPSWMTFWSQDNYQLM
jgi:5-methyltetrahydropteroyltriglutamate--homocysteine methyltransferase